MQKILLLHPCIKLRMRKLFFLIMAAFGFLSLNAQFITAAQWQLVDTSISLKKDLQSTENILKEWKSSSLRDSHYYDAARCYSNLIKIADLRTEDSLFFRNSACLDSALKTPGLPDALQYCFHLMQTQRLRQFLYKVSSYTRMKFNVKGLAVPYPLMKPEQFDSVIHLHYEEALSAALRLKTDNKYLPLWLISNAEPFLFRPGLYDIVISEQFQYDTYYRNLDYRKLVESEKSRELVRSWLSMSQDGFMEVIDSLGNLKTPLHNKYFIYSDWIFQHAADRETVYYIETIVRKELFSKLQYELKDADSLYEIYLQKLVHSPYGAVRATGVYQLAGLWHKQSENYTTSYYRSWMTSFPATNGFNEKWRLHNKKALDLFIENKSLYDSFGVLRARMLNLEKQIRDTDYVVSVEENNLPGKNLLGQAKYKNASRIYYTLYAVKNNIPKEADEYRYAGKPKEQLYISKTGAIELPEPGDYNTHFSFFKMDGLPPGNYLLRTSPFPQGQEGDRFNQLLFSVSNFSVLKQGSRVFVLNRTTGFPEPQVQIRYWETPDVNDTLHLKPIKVLSASLSDEGYFIPAIAKAITVAAISGRDTVYENFNFRSGDQTDDEVYSTDEFDNLAEYYVDKMSLSVYTDRKLYRPGQLMQFKAICLTQNPETGEKILLTPKNLGAKMYNQVMKLAAEDDNVLLYIQDPFGNASDTIPFALNDYASLSGKFKIPKTAATGEWEFESDVFDFDYNSNIFSVEEYKRPSYKIEMITPPENHLPGVPFEFKVKAKALTGAPLSGVKVKYTISRNSFLDDDEEDFGPGFRNVKATLADSFGVTGPDGILIIPVHDIKLPARLRHPDSASFITYSINVIATDAGGETHEKDDTYRATTRPVNLSFANAADMDLSAKPHLKLQAMENGVPKNGLPVELRMYRQLRPVDTFHTRELSAMDQWQYPLSQWKAWFPEYKFDRTPVDKFPEELVYTTTVTSSEKATVMLDPALFKAGEYFCVAVCRDSGRVKGSNEGRPYYFRLYDTKKRAVSMPGYSWYEVPYNSVKAGDTVQLFSGNAFDKVYAIYQIAWFSRKSKTVLNQAYETHEQQPGLEHWTWKVPADAVGKAQVTQTYIYRNQLYTYNREIYINEQDDDKPEIVVEKFRSSLSPGAAENFTISVKTRGENTIAELMTGMYDASLDLLQKHEWEVPEIQRNYSIPKDYAGVFSRDVNSQYESNDFRLSDAGTIMPVSYYWWNSMDQDVMGDWNNIPTARGLFGFENQLRLNFEPDILYSKVELAYGLSGRVSGLYVQTVNNGVFADNRITLRGIRSMTGSSEPMLVLDGVPTSLDELSKLDPSLINDVVVLKSVEGMALYGSRAANGVLVVSTKGKVILPPAKEEPRIPIRKNLNELAFFYPALYADKDGFYRISFTMPETLTEWKWMMLAHTKNALFAYMEQTLRSSLPLMVQPNMPRLLYQGDQIILKTRISNLDTAALKGNVQCKVENAVTGEDITASCITQSSFGFALDATVSGTQSFTLKVPSNLSDPLKITVKARSDQFADGEEHIIPVMSPLLLAKQSVSSSLTAGKDSLIHPPAIPADADPYGIAMMVKQRPQAAMLQSLPWLANYSYECAEQSFNKLYAHVMALQLMRQDKDAQHAFEKASAELEKEKQPVEMPEEVNAISMPWLSLSKKESDLQAQLFKLLDTTRTKEKMVYYLDRLISLQMADGGLAWFSGMQSNPFISAYVLAGFGHMQDKYIYSDDPEVRFKFLAFSDKLKSYCLLNRYPEMEQRSPVSKLFRLYAISQWKEAKQQPDSVMKEWRTWMKAYAGEVVRRPLYTQAIYVVTALRLFGNQDEAAVPALSVLRSIHERAIRDNEHGVRWKEMGDEDELSNSDEETLDVLAEAFDVSGFYPNEGAAILQWILGERNEDSWRTTRGTAAVIRLMEQYGKSIGGETAVVETRLDHKTFNLNNDLLGGQSSAFHASNDIFPVAVHNTGHATATTTVTWYYFTRPDELPGAGEDLSLQKELTVFDKKTGKMVEVNTQTVLHPGDTVYVKLIIQSKKLLRYVYIQDRRAAALEPADQLSGYVYGDRFNAYMSVRDAGHQFFAESIPSGMSTLKYNLVVMHEGSFSNGPASIECMYKPDISAWSRAQHITVKE